MEIAKAPQSGPSPLDMKEALAFFGGLDALKRLPRAGWVLRGVTNPESVAEHSFGVAALALYIGRKRGMDVGKLMTMATLHEVCEIKVGDLTPHDKVSETDKKQMESAAARAFLANIDKTGELFELWLDFDDGRTPEGRLIKDLDRVEMLLQAIAYEGQSEKPLDEFYPYVQARVKDPELLQLVNELVAYRNATKK